MNYIGIPTIDSFDYLNTTLDSIWCSYPDRILVVNNGEPLPENIVNYDDLIYNGENLGISKTWNQIIDWAMSFDDCESIFILNDDIKLREDTLDIMIKALEKFDITGAYMVKDLNAPTKEPRYVGGIHFSCFGVKESVVTEIGRFDENYTPFHVEDTDYWYRLIQAGFTSGTDREAKFIHYKVRPRGNAVRWKGKTVKEIHNRNRRYFMKKWGVSPKEIYKKSVEGSRR